MKAPTLSGIGTWLLSQCQQSALRTGRRLTNIRRLSAVEFCSLRLIVFSHFPKGAVKLRSVAKDHVWTSGNRGRVSSVRLHRGLGILVLGRTKELIMTNYVGLDVSQKTTTLCIVDGEGHRQWRGECVTSPEHIAQAVLQH